MKLKQIRKPALAASAALVFGLTMSACSADSGGSTDAGQPAATATEASVAPEAPEAPEAPTVGVPFTADMGNGNTARITVVSAEYTDTASAESFAPAAQNGGFLVLDVLWETESGVTSSNPLYFNAKDTEGRKGEYYMFADNQLGSGEVQVGDKSRGTVVFDIAPGPATVVITDPLLQEAARIQVGG
ncbi:hypothetical protein ACLRGH_08440 [Arthrobacter koreensis]|uniref:hypothetical protein n=1 Tax=Arthrobacter koreensis TaxID=199136 RepID=UPI003ACCB3D7